eukprot:maker-scaffold_14-snap-gene-10.17-mRNA-1 protein AED:0.00 eAED:0.00 QI:129/1/1/1/1/1/2/64/307
MAFILKKLSSQKRQLGACVSSFRSLSSTSLETASITPKQKEIKTTYDEIEKTLFECQVHLGHSKSRWNPYMKPYLLGVRNGRHIFDLRKTSVMLHRATRFLNDLYAADGRILFVGFKPDVAKLLSPLIPVNPNITFVGNKWVGGSLTNWHSIINHARDICQEAWTNDEVLEYFSDTSDKPLIDQKFFLMKKVADSLDEQMTEPKERRFFRNFAPSLDILSWEMIDKFSGGKYGVTLEKPSAMVIFHSADQSSQTAIKEGNDQHIPVIGIVDSDADPRSLDYVIPGNDDSLKAQYLYARILLQGFKSY